MKFTFNDCIKIKTQKEDITAPFQLMFKKERCVAGFLKTNKKLLGKFDFYWKQYADEW